MKLCVKKFTCFLLCFVMILLQFPNIAIAAERSKSETIKTNSGDLSEVLGESGVNYDVENISQQDENFDLDRLKALGVGEKSVDELKRMSVDVSSLPSFVPVDNAISKGHVHRVLEQESQCNTVIYQNKDGTKSTYIFGYPVKYIDNTGAKRDKSDKISLISNRAYEYAVLDNNVNIYFPKKITDGVLLRYNEYDIVISADSESDSQPVMSETENTIMYPEAFGKNTAILYTPKLSGYKEDIVLFKNINTYEFNFGLRVKGLTPVYENNIWVFKNSKGETVASLGDIVVKDSAGHVSRGKVEITLSDSVDEYELIVYISEQFANDPSTEYPIYIDPTTSVDYIYETGQYYDYIEGGPVNVTSIIDVGVYSSEDGYDVACIDTQYHAIGQFEGGYGAVIYKLFDFYSENGMFYNYNENQISGVYLHVDLAKTANTSLIAHPMKSTWNTDEDDDPIALYSTLINDYENVGSVATPIDPMVCDSRTIDVTNIAKGWAKYNRGASSNAYDDPNNGFILMSTASSDFVCIYSAESDIYNNDDVYLEVHTSERGGVYYIYQCLAGGFLSTNPSQNTVVTRIRDISWRGWIIEYAGEEKYYIKDNPNTQRTIFRNEHGNLSIGVLPSSPDDNWKWYINFANGGGVVITNACSGEVMALTNCNPANETNGIGLCQPLNASDSAYDLSKWHITLCEYYNELESFDSRFCGWVGVGSSASVGIDVFPSNATWRMGDHFMWESTNATVVKVEQDGTVTGLSEGTARIIVTHKPTRKVFSFTVAVGQIFDENTTYMIQNRRSAMFATAPYQQTSGNYDIGQSGYTSYEDAVWELEYCGDGYYYIRSCIDSAAFGSYLSVQNSSSLTQSCIVLYSTPTNGSKWRILPTLFGGYKLISACGESQGMVLSLSSPDATDGILYQSEYTNDFGYDDEWVLLESDSAVSGDLGLVDDEIYYIMNAVSRSYMSTADSSNSNMLNVVASGKSGALTQQWRLEKISGSSGYQIISCNGADGKALDVTGYNVDIFDNNNWGCQEFTIHRLNFAPYQGCYVIMQGGEYVYQTPSEDSPQDIRMSEEFSAQAVWSLSYVYPLSATRFSFNTISGFNTTGNNNKFSTVFDEAGYSVYTYVNDNAIDAFEYLVDRSSIFVYNGHGNYGCLAFINNSDTSNGHIYADASYGIIGNNAYIGDCANNELAMLLCAMYLGCSTAIPSVEGCDLLTSTYEKGAHFALGSMDTILVPDSMRFELKFYIAITDPDFNGNLRDAIEFGIAGVPGGCEYPTYGISGPFPVTYVGDSLQIFW